MRPDVDKILCERERRRYRCSDNRAQQKNHNRRQSCHSSYEDDQELPTKVSMRRPYRDRRSFSENLNILKGIIHKNLGKPWDKVYSEFSRLFPRSGGAVLQHVYQHLFDYICTKTRLSATGEVEVLEANEWLPVKDARRYWREDWTYYVHPKTNCICRVKKPKLRSWYQTQKEEQLKGYPPHVQYCDWQYSGHVTFHRFIATEDKNTEYRELGGVWYALKFTKPEYRTIVVKDDLGVPRRQHICTTKYIHGIVPSSYKDSRNLVCVSKKQLNKQQLKQLGLKK